jgi:hypothetical protein
MFFEVLMIAVDRLGQVMCSRWFLVLTQYRSCVAVV